jgi:hypothetical protein
MRYIHTLVFGTEDAAHAAHSQVVRLIGNQFLGWDVQEGGRRTFVVLDQPRSTATWRYLFATSMALPPRQQSRIHLATMADEALWNQA